jgi:hypothetical protein
MSRIEWEAVALYGFIPAGLAVSAILFWIVR